ncbi:hypothetical protein ABW20_dc0100598 [Dactylellina cionopaga]|nr:hypothetical protein ABW20_dc0100598 [Dactylellina cionopaga]
MRAGLQDVIQKPPFSPPRGGIRVADADPAAICRVKIEWIYLAEPKSGTFDLIWKDYINISAFLQPYNGTAEIDVTQRDNTSKRVCNGYEDNQCRQDITNRNVLRASPQHALRDMTKEEGKNRDYIQFYYGPFLRDPLTVWHTDHNGKIDDDYWSFDQFYPFCKNAEDFGEFEVDKEMNKHFSTWPIKYNDKWYMDGGVRIPHVY